MTMASSKVFDSIKHLCDSTLIVDGETYNTFNEELLLQKLDWWAPKDEKWYNIAAKYLGAGHYSMLYTDAEGTLLHCIEGQ
jgi:hypothetical protein